jgi:hypothetical protein
MRYPRTGARVLVAGMLAYLFVYVALIVPSHGAHIVLPQPDSEVALQECCGDTCSHDSSTCQICMAGNTPFELVDSTVTDPHFEKFHVLIPAAHDAAAKWLVFPRHSRAPPVFA